jgi:alpha-D-xyloside xylohydrolase
MVLEFPDDPGAATVDTQYMLGENLLVAPVFTAEGDVDVYVPEGTWTSLLTGDQVTGPRWVRERHGYLSLPLYVRPDSVLPVGARDDRPDYAWADGVTLRLVELADGHRSVTRVGDATFVVTRDGSAVRVEARGATGPWRVQVGVDGAIVDAGADEVVELAV